MSFYDCTAWKALRKAHLASNPWCKSCERIGYMKPAEHVDHMVTIREDPSRKLDPTNLQSLCQTCHSVKTQTEDRGTLERGNDLEGMPVATGHHWNT